MIYIIEVESKNHIVYVQDIILYNLSCITKREPQSRMTFTESLREALKVDNEQLAIYIKEEVEYYNSDVKCKVIGFVDEAFHSIRKEEEK